jgi:large subunit ribosomal protein L17
MRHNVDGRKLGRTAAHRRALYRNLAISLITHERIRTTTPKAKEARRLVDRLITFAKRGDLSARRHVASILNDKAAVQKLFDELGPRYADRPGGYTRVLKYAKVRRGDAAEMAMLELVKDGDRPDKKRSAKKAQPAVAPKPKQKAKVEEPVEEVAEEAAATEEAAVEEPADDGPAESDENEDKKD